MQESVYIYLKFARYRDIENWSVSHILGMNMGFNEDYPMVSIGQIIKRNPVAVDIEDNVSYKQITLKTNGGGAILRDVKQGKNIGTKKQFIVSAGQFIMSKIDARNGAFGVVGADLDGAVVTADFPVFDVVKEKVMPEYLSLISSTAPFVRFAQSCSRGTTNRQRIDVSLFLSQKIPLPTIKEQQALVESYKNKIKQSEQLEEQATQAEQYIEDYLLSELGIKQKSYKFPESDTALASEPQIEYVVSNRQIANRTDTYHWGDEIKKEYKYLKFVRFKDVKEWGIDLMKSPNTNVSELYPKFKIKDICCLGSGGTPSRARPQYYNGDIPWIKTGEVINEEIFETEEHITQDAIDNSSARMYPKGSLIIAMYGQGDTRGRTAKLGINATTNQACAVLYNIDNNIVVTDYLWYYLQGRYHDLRSLASGNNQPNLNAGKIKSYEIPIPPIDIQNAIVEHINRQKEQIKQLKQQAESLRKEALEEFEKEIFE